MEMGEQCSIMNEGSENWIFKFKNLSFKSLFGVVV